MSRKREPEIPVTPSSGNVFADLGFAEPEEELAKAQFANSPPSSPKSRSSPARASSRWTPPSRWPRTRRWRLRACSP